MQEIIEVTYKEELMKKVSILIAISLALIVMSVSVFGTAQKEVATTQATQVEKPASITFMVDGTFQVKENGEQILVDGFKALTGIDLVLNHPIHNEYYQKVNLAFSTGDIPDVVLLGNNPLVTYATAGALYDITDLYDKSELKKRIKDQSLIEAIKVNGKLYGIPGDRGNGTITYVRGDWLEKLKLEPPKNYDEFINMLRLFKTKNPDGLAPENVIPITAAGLVGPEYPWEIYMREFYQDATIDFVKRNGVWVDGMTEKAMEKALIRMRDAYAEGLIDTEIITNKTSTCRDKFYSGNVGVFNYWAGTWNFNLIKNITPKVPQAKVVPIPPIKETKYIERPATVYAITKACKNPEAVFKHFIEVMLDGGPGQTLATFGVEGKFYEKVDGKIKFLPSMQNPKNLYTKAWISPEIPMTNWTPNWLVEPSIINSLNMFQANMVAYQLLPASEVMTKLLPELTTIKTSYVTKIVYGKVTLEEGLDAYKKEAAKYIEAILNDLNKK